MAKENPRIKIAIPDDYRFRALIEGEVGIEEYDLDIVHNISSPGERHYRFAQGEFDVGEFSTATFLRTKEKGRRFLALPIFHDRGPRQRNIFYCEGRLSHQRRACPAIP